MTVKLEDQNWTFSLQMSVKSDPKPKKSRNLRTHLSVWWYYFLIHLRSLFCAGRIPNRGLLGHAQRYLTTLTSLLTGVSTKEFPWYRRSELDLPYNGNSFVETPMSAISKSSRWEQLKLWKPAEGTPSCNWEQWQVPEKSRISRHRYGSQIKEVSPPLGIRFLRARSSNFVWHSAG